MSRFIKQFQNIISSKDAHAAGFLKTKDATGKMLNDFFEEIVATVMAEGDKQYLIQWAISELEKEDLVHEVNKH